MVVSLPPPSTARFSGYDLLSEANAWLRHRQQGEISPTFFDSTSNALKFPWGSVTYCEVNSMQRLVLEDSMALVAYQFGEGIHLFRQGASPEDPSFDDSPLFSHTKIEDIAWVSPTTVDEPWVVMLRWDGEGEYRTERAKDARILRVLQTKTVRHWRTASHETRLAWLIEAGAVPTITETIAWQW